MPAANGTSAASISRPAAVSGALVCHRSRTTLVIERLARVIFPSPDFNVVIVNMNLAR
jgi:hypothetical protein